jgi:hypothetical protein
MSRLSVRATITGTVEFLVCIHTLLVLYESGKRGTSIGFSAAHAAETKHQNYIKHITVSYKVSDW